MPINDPALIDVLSGHDREIGMFEAPCSEPMSCCYGTLCPYCAAYTQRREIMEITNEPYHMCNGLCCCCSGPVSDSMVPCCLGCEVCCCVGMTMMTNRYMVQTRFRKENTGCDDCLITCVSCMQCLVCCIRCFQCLSGNDAGNGDEGLEDCLIATVDCLTAIVMGCMYAQQELALETVRKEGYHGVSHEVMECLPPRQQEMISNAQNSESD